MNLVARFHHSSSLWQNPVSILFTDRIKKNLGALRDKGKVGDDQALR